MLLERLVLLFHSTSPLDVPTLSEAEHQHLEACATNKVIGTCSLTDNMPPCHACHARLSRHDTLD